MNDIPDVFAISRVTMAVLRANGTTEMEINRIMCSGSGNKLYAVVRAALMGEVERPRAGFDREAVSPAPPDEAREEPTEELLAAASGALLGFLDAGVCGGLTRVKVNALAVACQARAQRLAAAPRADLDERAANARAATWERAIAIVESRRNAEADECAKLLHAVAMAERAARAPGREPT